MLEIPSSHMDEGALGVRCLAKMSLLLGTERSVAQNLLTWS